MGAPWHKLHSARFSIIRVNSTQVKSSQVKPPEGTHVATVLPYRHLQSTNCAYAGEAHYRGWW